MAERRKDSKGRVLKENETQRPDGTYRYRWRTADGKRHNFRFGLLGITDNLEEVNLFEQYVTNKFAGKNVIFD